MGLMPKPNSLPRLVALALAVTGALVAWWWWQSDSGHLLKERLPGQDRAVAGPASGSPMPWQAKLIKGDGVPAELTGVWPGFRGPNRDGISPETVPLARAWGPTGPKVLWQIGVGEGYAAAGLWKGRVFMLDYDHQAKADALRCLSLADGREIWRYTYPVRVKRDHGMSRTIPAVTEKFVVSLGPKCHVICVDTLSGELRWRTDLVSEFNAEVPPWYAGQCPLVEGDRVILAPGGDALVVALELATGKVLWKSANPRRWQMTHSSVTPLEWQGRRMFVYCASGGVSGVSATDGAILWDTPDWKINIANVPSPVWLGDGRLFLCGGYDAGCLMLELKEAGSKLSVQPVFRLKASVFGAVQHTPIRHQDHLFGVRQDGQLVCLRLDGKIAWESGAAHKFGKGPLLIAQGLLFVMDDDGVLTLAEANPAGYHQLAQAKVLPGPDAWGPMALADGRLVLRDLYRMACLDVRADNLQVSSGR